MKIMSLVPRMELGGVEREVVDLSKALVQGRHASIVISAGGALAQTIGADGGQHLTLDLASKNVLTAYSRARRLRRLWQQHQPDVVHVHSRVPAWLLRLSGAVAERAPFKIVSTIHGLYSVSRYSAQMTRADWIICPSRAVLAYAQKNYAVPETKLRLVPGGVDFGKFAPPPVSRKNDAVRAELRKQWQVQPDDFLVAIVGRVTALKGHEFFVRAIAAAVAMAPPRRIIGVIIGGGGARERQLKNTIAQGGLVDRFRFAGVCRDMPAVYRAVDLLVSASHKPESFGLVMAEALAIECPVVSAAHGGALDIIHPEQNGLLFPPGDSAAAAAAIVRAMQTPWSGLRASVRQFSQDAMAEKTLAVYVEKIATK